VRYHYDELCARNLLEQFHDLNARSAVKRARRLVREYDLGIVYYRAGNRNSLHLTARQLVGQFFHLSFESDRFQSLFCASFTLRKSDTRQSQCHSDVVEYSQMLYQIVTLKDETYLDVAVCIPVYVLVFLGRNSVDEHISRRVSVKTAYYVEHGSLAATAVSEYGHKLRASERKVDPFESVDDAVARFVIFSDVNKLKHESNSLDWYLSFYARVRPLSNRYDAQKILLTYILHINLKSKLSQLKREKS